jgi:hypothetical protein
MDITFEEVAHVIQDARYQQAIFDTETPKPERSIPRPPRGFNHQDFIRQYKIDFDLMIKEPMGRFFLEMKVQPASMEHR